MPQINLRTKRLGNSIGLILPQSVVQKENIKPNEEIQILLIKNNPLKETFGMLKGKIKQSSQKMKDEFRKTLYD